MCVIDPLHRLGGWEIDSERLQEGPRLGSGQSALAQTRICL